MKSLGQAKTGITSKDDKQDVKKDDTEEEEEKNEYPFTYEEMVKHYFAIVIPSNDDLPMPVTEMKGAISDYNKSKHQSEGLKVTSNLFGREFHIVLVKTFSNMEKGNNYMEAWQAEADQLQGINDQGYQIMLVSKNNYLTIFKERNLDVYIDFLQRVLQTIMARKGKTMARNFDNSPENAINRIVENTEVQGDIVSESNVRIDGRFSGNINTKGRLVIGQSGVVIGSISCENAEVEGALEGSIKVKALLTLKSTAKLEGEIFTDKLSIEPGAQFSGECYMGAKVKNMSVGEEEFIATEERTA